MFERDFDQIRAVKQGLKTIDCENINLKKLTHIASGTYNDVFSYTIPGGTSVFRLSYYNKRTIAQMEKLIAEKKEKGGPEYADRKSDAYKQLMVEARNLCSMDSVWIKIHFSELTNFFVKQSISPHFVYTFTSKDCKKALDHISKVIPQKTLDNRVRKESSCHRRYNNVSFQEPFDMDLTTALRKSRNPSDPFRMNDDDLRHIVFQVLFTLGTLQHYVPMFRHNDLSTNNVLIKVVPMNNKMYTYQLYDAHFQVIAPRFFAAIHDFDLAHADAYIMHMGGERARFSLQNRVVLDKAFTGVPGAEHIRAEYNPSFDPFFFLKGLYKQIEERHFPKTYYWLKRVLLVDMHDKYLPNVIESYIPGNLLRDTQYFCPLMSAPMSAPAMFGPKLVDLDVHVGGSPVLSNRVRETSDTSRIPQLTTNNNTLLIGHVANGFQSVLAPLATAYESVILRFYKRPQETAQTGKDADFRFDAAIAFQACETEDRKALEWLALKLSVPYQNKTNPQLCADLKKAVRSQYYDETFDESDMTVYPRCPVFFTDEEIFKYAKAQGVPEQDLYVPNLFDFEGNPVPKSREDLCLLAFAMQPTQ